MEIKKGIGVSHGVVISSAIVLDAEDTVIPRRQIDPANAPAEITRLQEAVASSVVEIAQLRDGISAQHGKEIGGIFDVHLGMLKDPTLLNQIVTEIRARNVSAEHAVSVVMRGYANSFLKLSDRYFSERVKDIYDIERRILRYLIGRQHEDLGRLTQSRPGRTVRFEAIGMEAAGDLRREFVHRLATIRERIAEVPRRGYAPTASRSTAFRRPRRGARPLTAAIPPTRSCCSRSAGRWRKRAMTTCSVRWRCSRRGSAGG